MISSFASLLIFLLSSGGNDLLDYLQSDMYWSAKNVTVAIDQLTGELVPPKAEDISNLIRQLGSDDPTQRESATQKIMQAGPVVLPQLKTAADGPNRAIASRASNLVEGLTAAGKSASVRRLMAIRTLGELKKPEAIASLKPLLESKESFVAEYAANAIAMIEGRATSRPVPTAKLRTEELNLLPAKMDVVAQYTFTSGSVMTIEQLLTSGNIVPSEQRKAMMQTIAEPILEVAEKIGNVRLDLVTGGMFTNLPNAPGHGVIVIHGSWDSTAMAAAVEQVAAMGVTLEMVDGVQVFREGKTAALIMASDKRAVLVLGDDGANLPVEAMVASLKKGTGDFADNAQMAKLLTTVDQTAALWLVTNVTDGLRQVVPPLQAFETASLTVNRTQNDTLTLKWQAVGKNADGVKAAVDDANQNVKAGIQEITQEVKKMPAIQPALDFLNSIHMDVNGSKVTGGATIKGASQMLPLFFLGIGARAELDVKPPPVAPQPLPPK